MNRLTKEFVCLHNHQGYPLTQWFSWFLDDCLATFGRHIVDLPPESARSVLFELGGLYAREVRESRPFLDVLGQAYMELASNGQRKWLGQFFTPWPVAEMMARMQLGTDPIPADRLTRVHDPAMGSGVMLLAFAAAVADQLGPETLQWFSFSGIDLDAVCARMTPLQLLANVLIHQLTVGEILAYHGNALLDPAELAVVVHLARSDLPEPFAPASDPRNVTAVVEAAKMRAASPSMPAQLTLFAE